MLITESESPLFQKSLVYKPFSYQVFYDLMKAHEKVHWITDEAELGDDVTDWRLNSSDEERSFIKTILTIFTTGDVAVAQNYKEIFIPAFQNNEVSNWLTSVAARETIHQDAYAMANETFGLPDSLFAEFTKYKEMRDRIDLMTTQYNPQEVEGQALALAHTTFNEGVGLFGAFVNLLHLHRFDIPGHNGHRGRYKGLTKVNKWSLRDESLHVDGSSALYKQVMREHRHLMNDGHKKQVYDIARKVVGAEDAFLDLAFQNYNLPTITKDEVKAYIRKMTNRRLVQLGFKEIYQVSGDPCSFVDEILNGSSGKRQGNFFETRVDQYQASGALVGKVDWKEAVAEVPL